MNKQRKVVITITYNEMGIIVDTKAEELGSSAQPERKTGKWNFIGDNMFECTSCGVVYTTNQLNSLRNYDTDPYAPKFCPNCGSEQILEVRVENDE